MSEKQFLDKEGLSYLLQTLKNNKLIGGVTSVNGSTGDVNLEIPTLSNTEGTSGTSTTDGYTQSFINEVNNKNYYNLGAYDSIVDNGDGTGTVYRKTRYTDLGTLDWRYADGAFYAFLFSISDRARYHGYCSKYTNSSDDVNWNEQDDKHFNIGQNISGGGPSIGIKDTDYSDVDTFKNAVSGVILIHEVAEAYTYTETVILNQPIHTLNQDMEQRVRAEVEKGLNLFDNDLLTKKSFSASGNSSSETMRIELWYDLALTSFFNMVFIENGGKSNTITFTLNSNSNIYARVGINGSIADDKYYIDTPLYLTAGTYTLTLNLESEKTQGSATIRDIMLTKGTIPYPYQPYKGEIIRESDVNGVLLWENGSPTSTYGEGDITLNMSLSNFKYVVFECKDYSDYATQIYKFRLLQSSVYLYLNYARGGGSGSSVSRAIQVKSYTEIRVNYAYSNGTSDLTRLIPYRIYGTNVL
jgi:hypothetical protein